MTYDSPLLIGYRNNLDLVDNGIFIGSMEILFIHPVEIIFKFKYNVVSGLNSR